MPHSLTHSKALRMLSLLLLVWAVCLSIIAEAQNTLEDEIAEIIQVGLAKSLKLPTNGYSTSELDAALKLWYSERSFIPLWSNSATLLPQANQIVEALKNSEQDGLNPDDYYLKLIQDYWGKSDLKHRAKLDLLLTLAAAKLVADARRGRLEVRAIDMGPYKDSGFDRGNFGLMLRDVLYRADIGEAISEQFPQHRQYLRMKAALSQYREIEKRGGWGVIPGVRPLIPGTRDPRVSLLAKRLIYSGDLETEQNPSDLFNIEIEAAVKVFQQRHGIPTTGEVHGLTLAALNIPVQARIRSLIINLERWRWLARDFTEDKEIYVNIAGYELFGLGKSSINLRMPVIVGKKFNATPIFSGMISYIEVNPYWNVPTSIVEKEMLPKLKKNSNYLSNEHMRLYEKSGKSIREISSETINWNLVTATQIRNYAIKQDPGPWNALGKLKFVFPNPYSVYLHDTANPELFSQIDRAFSHGCIRVSKPAELAAFLLDGPENKWTVERVQELVATEEHQIVKLPSPIRIHITYRSAWVDLDQSVNFRADLYGRDAKLERVIFKSIS
jgi:murein L,D-transpeptidase YcbB/YkuD